MRRRVLVLSSWLALAGCDAPTVEVTHADALTDDATIDAVDDEADVPSGDDAGITDVFFSDGRPCRGHDEDHDGVPDECDDCPGLFDKQTVGKTIGIGTACNAITSDGVHFERASKRLFFDAFTEYGADWKSSGGGEAAFMIDGTTNDDMVGGTGGDADFRFLVRRAAAGASTTVATTVLSTGGAFENPLSGLIVRAVGDPKRFFMCFRGLGARFGILVTPPEGCSGGPCAYEILTQATIPPELLTTPGAHPLGLRMSVTSGAPPATTGRVECLIFDPEQPLSVHTGDSRFIVRADVAEAQWIPSGEVGLATVRMRATFAWLDVFTEP